MTLDGRAPERRVHGAPHEAHVIDYHRETLGDPLAYAQDRQREYRDARRGADRPKLDERLWRRVKLAREGAAVERCHVWPHLQRYSVGHHAHDVVSLVILCWQAEHDGRLPRAELICAAHFHDTPECVTGDLPRPVKDLLGGALSEAERATLEWLYEPTSLTVEELAYVEAADCVELMIWANEEVLRGNSTLLDWATASLADGGRGARLPRPFRAVVAEMSRPGALRRYDFAELREIAGL